MGLTDPMMRQNVSDTQLDPFHRNPRDPTGRKVGIPDFKMSMAMGGEIHIQVPHLAFALDSYLPYATLRKIYEQDIEVRSQ
jgi:hypothetical protein